MLRIEEIVGAMDDEFRYALDVLSDERLEQLKADKSALRRLRPVGVSHAEALAMIAAIQQDRADRHRREAARLARQAISRPTKRRSRRTKPVADSPDNTRPALIRPQPVPLLAAPRARGPAIRLPAPASAATVIALGGPVRRMITTTVRAILPAPPLPLFLAAPGASSRVILMPGPVAHGAPAIAMPPPGGGGISQTAKRVGRWTMVVAAAGLAVIAALALGLAL